MLALEQRLNDFFDEEDVYVMGVSDASHSFNRKAVGKICSLRYTTLAKDEEFSTNADDKRVGKAVMMKTDG